MDNFENENNMELNNAEEYNNGFSVTCDVDDIAGDSEISNKETIAREGKADAFTSGLFEWLEVVITAVISVVLIFTLLFRVATIDGPSMQNTLHNGDKVIISNLAYTPKNGDIVVISRNVDNSSADTFETDLPIIKRVIATEGQTVDIDFTTGEVFVDGNLLDEPYISTPTKRKFDVKFPLTVPPGCIFVMGDNRMDSLDSRHSGIGNEGMIDVRYVLGRAILRVFPFNNAGKLY